MMRVTLANGDAMIRIRFNAIVPAGGMGRPQAVINAAITIVVNVVVCQHIAHCAAT